MFVWEFLVLIECLFVGIISCQDSNPLSIDVDQEQIPDVNVFLSVDAQPKSSDVGPTIDPQGDQTSDSFTCHECTTCHDRSTWQTRACDPGINMCYKINRHIDNKNQIIRRGCSTTKEQCTIPNDDLSNPLDSVTCCTTSKCNQGIQLKPLFFLLTIYLFIIIIIYI